MADVIFLFLVVLVGKLMLLKISLDKIRRRQKRKPLPPSCVQYALWYVTSVKQAALSK